MITKKLFFIIGVVVGLLSSCSPNNNGKTFIYTPSFTNKINYETYSNIEMGFTFNYPNNWKIIYESRYQTAAEEVSGHPDPNPPMFLENEDLNEELDINGRQCHVQIELKGGNWLCLDKVIPPDRIPDTFVDSVDGIEEEMGYMSIGAKEAISMIQESFRVLT